MIAAFEGCVSRHLCEEESDENLNCGEGDTVQDMDESTDLEVR